MLITKNYGNNVDVTPYELKKTLDNECGKAEASKSSLPGYHLECIRDGVRGLEIELELVFLSRIPCADHKDDERFCRLKHYPVDDR